jgi:hypothetical protein
MRRRLPWWVALYLVVRLFGALSPEPAFFTDSADYRWRWAATNRPYGISLLFDLLGQGVRIVVVQTIIASVLWCWLFVELWKSLSSSPRVRFGTLAVVVTFSLSRPIVMWDRAVLSECLAFGLIAAGSAVALRARRAQDTRSVVLMLAVLVAMAVTREVVLIAWGLPLALFVFARHKTRAIIRLSLVSLGFVAALVSLWPTTARYGPENVTIANYRAMNVIGVRILPDPYLRSQMERAGLPKTDPSLHGAFGFSNDYKLYQSPRMLDFANNFPTARYLIAELRRPGLFYRYALPALDVETIRALDQFGDRNAAMLPMVIDRLLWNWAGKLHLSLLVASTFLRFRLRPREAGVGTVWTSALLGGWVASAGAVTARVLDTLEQGRHAFPFLATARISLVVSLVCAVGVAFEDERVRRALRPHRGDNQQ